MFNFTKQYVYGLIALVSILTSSQSFCYWTQQIYNNTPFNLAVTIWETGYHEHKDIIVAPHAIEPINVGWWCAWRIIANATAPSADYPEKGIKGLILENTQASFERPEWNKCTSGEYTVNIEKLPSGQYRLYIVSGIEPVPQEIATPAPAAQQQPQYSTQQQYQYPKQTPSYPTYPAYPSTTQQQPEIVQPLQEAEPSLPPAITEEGTPLPMTTEGSELPLPLPTAPTEELPLQMPSAINLPAPITQPAEELPPVVTDEGAPLPMTTEELPLPPAPIEERPLQMPSAINLPAPISQ